MEGNDERFSQPNFSLEAPTLRGIYLSIIRPSLAEFFGVYFLTFGLYACIVFSGDMVGSIAIVFLYIGIYSVTRNISGGHLNPIITIIQVARRSLFPLLGSCYIFVHIGGAVAGALSVKGITDDKPSSPPSPPYPPEKMYGAGHKIFAEMMGTTIVILAYLTLASKSKGNTAILGIGFGYAGALLAVHTASKGYLNPVINFGISVASGEWTDHYVYWAGTALAGILATLLHGLVFASDDQVWLRRRNHIPERIA